MLDLLRQARLLRRPLPDDDNDAFRVFDGVGDGIPDLEIDEFAGRWLVSTRDQHLPRGAIEAFAETGRSVYHKRLDQRQKDSPERVCGPLQEQPFVIRENGLRFEVSFASGYSQGIFLDQRDNRLRLNRTLTPGSTLLNTFAYTGAFSVAAAAAGAETTTLDLSQPYLDWAKRNFLLNAIDPATQHFCKGDTFHWLRRFAKQGRRFDAIILDPPTFSRDHEGRIFRVEEDYTQLVEIAAACLAPDGTLLACTNYRKLDDSGFERQVRDGFNRPVQIESAEMPTDFTANPYLKSLWVTA